MYALTGLALSTGLGSERRARAAAKQGTSFGVYLPKFTVKSIVVVINRCFSQQRLSIQEVLEILQEFVDD